MRSGCRGFTTTFWRTPGNDTLRNELVNFLGGELAGLQNLFGGELKVQMAERLIVSCRQVCHASTLGFGGAFSNFFLRRSSLAFCCLCR